MARQRTEDLTGIYERLTARGMVVRATIRVNGVLVVRPWVPRETVTNDELRAWRKAQLAPTAINVHATPGTFAADVDDYCRQRRAMPTINQVTAHLQLFVAGLGGDRLTTSITAKDLNLLYQEWLTTPHRPEYTANRRAGRPTDSERGHSDQTIRKRRATLSAFFTHRFGKGGFNPVRTSQSFPSADPELRGPDFETLVRIHAAMPTYRDTKRGAPPQLALAKAVVGVIAYAGLGPQQQKDLDRLHDVQLTGPQPMVHLGRRRKGRGTIATDVALTPAGVDAFRAWLQVFAYQPGRHARFSVSATNVSFKRAARRLGLTAKLSQYGARHAHGAQTYVETGDTATVARRLGLAPGSPMVNRYVAAGFKRVDRQAAAGFLGGLGIEALQVAAAAIAGDKLPVKVTRPRKSRGDNKLEKTG